MAKISRSWNVIFQSMIGTMRGTSLILLTEQDSFSFAGKKEISDSATKTGKDSTGVGVANMIDESSKTDNMV